jgi:LysR family glycine cleavage system transcriptional activator
MVKKYSAERKINNLKRLPLTALRTFEAAARLESFKDAADELNVSVTTVSNQIRMLEREWGCLLFNRMTRQVVLTEIGQSLSRVVRGSFEAIVREIDFHIGPKRYSVSMAVGPMFGARWLMPRLLSFRTEFPSIDLVLRRGRRVSSANDMPAAVVVDWGVGDWVGLEVEPLMKIRYAPVMAPGLLPDPLGPITATDLIELPILHQQDKSEWRAWLDKVGVNTSDFKTSMVIDDSNVAIQAALLAQGVLLGIFPFVQDDVEKGHLLKPFEEELVPEKSYFILTRPGSRRLPEVAALCDWLHREANAYALQYPYTRMFPATEK